MNYSYCVVKNTYLDKEYTSYGISAVKTEDDQLTVLKSFDNLSTDYNKVAEFVELCNDLRIDIVHMPDIVEDILS